MLDNNFDETLNRSGMVVKYDQGGWLERGSLVVKQGQFWARKGGVAFAAGSYSGRICGGVIQQQPFISSEKVCKIDRVLEDTLIDNARGVESLTRREAEVLKLIVSGKTNKEIAKALCRSRRTIEYHRNSVMRKLGAHNAVDLVKRAIKMKMAL